jgi:hypothetical protein
MVHYAGTPIQIHIHRVGIGFPCHRCNAMVDSRRWGVGGCEALDLFQKIFQVSREGMILFSDLVSCNGEQRRLDDRGVIDVIR